jgi:uncharacterized integral membrane protein
MRRIAIVIIILLAVFTFINAYTVERSAELQEARFTLIEEQQ